MNKIEIFDVYMENHPFIVIKNNETRKVTKVDYGWADSTIWYYEWIVNLFKFAGIESEVTRTHDIDLFEKLLAEGYEEFDYCPGRPEY